MVFVRRFPSLQSQANLGERWANFAVMRGHLPCQYMRVTRVCTQLVHGCHGYFFFLAQPRFLLLSCRQLLRVGGVVRIELIHRMLTCPPFEALDCVFCT